uniref:Protein tweety homolog n=1 Tax=Papio anubis TaxID=9555 RepID=A0A2I3LZQ0_PAPAN
MQAARVDYIAPWWVVWLHSVPHLGLRLQPVNSTFNPGDESYQESLLFLGLVAAVCLGLNLIFLVAYLVCACCCQQDDAVQTKQRHSCCITWTAVVAGLVCCAAVGVGFYGNSETNDGVYQLMYSLEDANHTFSGIDALVSGTTRKMKVDLEQHLARLSEIFAARATACRPQFIQQMHGSCAVVQLSGLLHREGSHHGADQAIRPDWLHRVLQVALLPPALYPGPGHLPHGLPGTGQALQVSPGLDAVLRSTEPASQLGILGR